MDFKLPSELKISKKSTGSIISISSLIGTILSIFSFFKFDNLELNLKIIIILSIFLIISCVDIVILYVRDREMQYMMSYINLIIKNINDQIIKIKDDSNDIRKTNNEIINDINVIKSNIKLNSKV